MNDLEQATTEELIDELQKRCLGTLVVTITESPDSADDEDFSMIYSGGLTQAIGMANRACTRLKAMGATYEPEEEEADGEAT